MTACRRTVPLLVAVLVACGDGSAISARDVGTVCHAVDHGEDTFGPADYFAPEYYEPTWLRLRDRDQIAHGEPLDDPTLATELVRLTSPERLHGPGVARVEVSVLAVDEALSELGRGSEIVLVAPPETPTRIVASVRDDGTVAFLGECAARGVGTPFAAFVDARHGGGDRRSAAELLYALGSDPSLRSALREHAKGPSPEPAGWESVPAERRVIDPDGAAPPAEVMATLAPHLLHFSYPQRWKGFEASLATFVPGVGWNPAVPLRIESDDPAVLAYVSLTAPLEVWAIAPPGDITRPLARLATFPPTTFAGREDVTFRAVTTAATLDELVERAKRGETVFEARQTPE